jgi:UDP-N-acetylglucosamine 2-epimerase (non-hydrolysing)
MRIIIVVGARPNVIKVAPLMPVLAGAGVDAQVAHTGVWAAYASDDVFRDLGVPEPSWFLDAGWGTARINTAKATVALAEILDAERPDVLMVVGDLSPAVAGALAGLKVGIPVVHLEAGVRSGDTSLPEEVNRLVADQLSALLLTPTERAEDDLIAEGADAERVRFVGSIMAE